MKTQVSRIVLGSLICLALLTTFSTSGAQPPTSSPPTEHLRLDVSEPPPPIPEPQMAPLRARALEPLPPGTGFIPPPMDLSHLTGQKMPKGAVPQALPDVFDWRNKDGNNYVSPVKNQGNCGSCYTFATIGNFEARLLIEGESLFDFSENNAKECNWRELNNFQYPNPGDYWGSCDGGNAFMLASLFSQKGTVLETCDPYQDSDVNCNPNCPYQKTLLDWRIISGDAVPSTQVLKQYIYDHGPVITSMYADSGQGFNGSYDGSYTFNYTVPPGNTNHAVLIVGWSNNLPPVPGGTDPADGWIVKNSWGTGWGDNGYFYITYGAANIGTSSSFIHDWQDYDVNGDIWYYDDDGWWGSWGYNNPTAWGLVKFIPPEDTKVTRVEFWTTDATTDIDVYIYDDFDGTTLSNLLASKENLSFDEAGYHSVALDSPLAVTAGDDVIAVVKFTNESYGYPIATDPHGTVETGRTYMSLSGSGWTDMGVTHNTDVAIRLRTSKGSVPTPNAIYLPLVLRNHPAPPPRWVIILSEDFEGPFPGSTWSVSDNDSNSGLYYWGKRDCRSSSGSFSAWSVGAGDTTLSCGNDYPNDVFAWMVYGPFSLADATAAELLFDWWSETELTYDMFFWGASIDGNEFWGSYVTGDWSSWTMGERLDLSNVYHLGNLLGEDEVWIAFVFGSDSSNTYEGSYVDNVVLRKQTGGGTRRSQSPPSLQRVLQPNQTMEFVGLRLSQAGIQTIR
ncbi:MAG: hypothetical protein DRI80_03270 [Chloroflexota bacterium]|nr:MAG: hypothetical protein DRI80_03270 [Chloroflexota bacterium]